MAPGRSVRTLHWSTFRTKSALGHRHQLGIYFCRSISTVGACAGRSIESRRLVAAAALLPESYTHCRFRKQQNVPISNAPRPVNNPVAAVALSIVVACVAGLLIVLGIIWAFS
jgi:hypothetical protein